MHSIFFPSPESNFPHPGWRGVGRRGSRSPNVGGADDCSGVLGTGELMGPRTQLEGQCPAPWGWPVFSRGNLDLLPVSLRRAVSAACAGKKLFSTSSPISSPRGASSCSFSPGCPSVLALELLEWSFLTGELVKIVVQRRRRRWIFLNGL